MYNQKSWKKYYLKNKKKICAYHRDYYQKNKETRLKQIYNYEKIRKKKDPNYKLRKDLKRVLNQAINYYEKRGVVLKTKYPINLKSIIIHLSPFPNRKIYQIDHIKPLYTFDLTNQEQIKEAFAPKNHQWLTPKQNMKKGKSLK